ncbi:MAG: DNA/RNA non-specific endonuclease [Alistipes sp.]|nr:DNA/RNA non-specific endonuclease [Alistipes sp.]
MKKLLIWVFALAGLGLMIHACDDKNEVLLSDDPAPELRVTCNHSINLPSARATEGVIRYEVQNPYGEMIATAHSSDDWVKPEISTKGQLGSNNLGQPLFTASISYEAAANRGRARKADLTISYGGCDPVVLTISQPAGESDPTPDPSPSGNTLVAGWAELPTTIESDDLHYTYHITDVKAGANYARNYAACYSSEKMCAIWVAAPMHDFYAVKNTSREDNYKTDPNFDFTQPGKWSGYTRGHLLGSAERLVSRKANDQVFYHTNIAPQHSTYFNTGGGAWNTLEEWVDKQWVGKADTTYQVIGCYWDPAATAKSVSGTTIPTHYYKVLLRTKNHQNKWVVNCSKDELQCIAVLVEHRTYEKAEVPKPTDYELKGMFLTVKELEDLTGLTFFGNVPNAPKEQYNLSEWTF